MTIRKPKPHFSGILFGTSVRVPLHILKLRGPKEVTDSKYGPIVWALTSFLLAWMEFEVWALAGYMVHNGYILGIQGLRRGFWTLQSDANCDSLKPVDRLPSSFLRATWSPLDGTLAVLKGIWVGALWCLSDGMWDVLKVVGECWKRMTRGVRASL